MCLTASWQLATGLRKVITGEPGMRIKREAKRLEKLGIRITGRQLLFLLYDEFTISSTEQETFSLTDLVTLRGPKGKDLEAFMTSWFNVLGQLEDPPPQNVLCSLFHSKIMHLTDLLEKELDAYERAEVGAPAKTYPVFLKSVEDLLLRRRHKAIRSEYSSSG